MNAAALNQPFAQVALSAAAAAVLAGLWTFVPIPLFPIAAVLGVAGLAAAIARPFLTCLAFLAVTYFRIHEAYPILGPLRLPLVFSALALAALFWHVVVLRSIRPFYRRELVLFLAFFGLVTAGIAVAVNRPLALDAWTTVYWKIGVMTLALAWLVRTPGDLRLASTTFVIFGAAIGAVAIHNKQQGIGLVELTRVTIGRDINSVLGDPNDLALVLVFPLSFSMSLMLYGNGVLRRALGGLAVAIILGGIIATQSRGGLIGVAAVVAVFGFRLVRSKVVLVCSGASVAIALYAAMNIASRVSGGAQEAGIDLSASERLETWKAAVNMALARPLTGVGLSNFADNFYFYTDTFRGRSLVAHSTWFSALGETGLPGFIVFLAMVIACLRSAVGSLRASRLQSVHPGLHVEALSLFAALVGFCASATFLNQTFSWPLYVLLALVAALGRLIDDEIDACRSGSTGTSDEAVCPPRHPGRGSFATAWGYT